MHVPNTVKCSKRVKGRTLIKLSTLFAETSIFIRTKRMKTVNNVIPFLARFFYQMIYKVILGFVPTFQSYFEILNECISNQKHRVWNTVCTQQRPAAVAPTDAITEANASHTQSFPVN